jgi:hypothetical protein
MPVFYNIDVGGRNVAIVPNAIDAPRQSYRSRNKLSVCSTRAAR